MIWAWASTGNKVTGSSSVGKVASVDPIRIIDAHGATDTFGTMDGSENIKRTTPPANSRIPPPVAPWLHAVSATAINKPRAWLNTRR
jgi:hypothetical protein